MNACLLCNEWEKIKMKLHDEKDTEKTAISNVRGKHWWILLDSNQRGEHTVWFENKLEENKSFS